MLTSEQKQARTVITQVEAKYAEKKRVMVMGYERAKTEEKVHYKQKDYRKYEKLFDLYAYPINTLKLEEADTADVISTLRDSDQLAKL
jgi:hypothetical protein